MKGRERVVEGVGLLEVGVDWCGCGGVGVESGINESHFL